MVKLSVGRTNWGGKNTIKKNTGPDESKICIKSVKKTSFILNNEAISHDRLKMTDLGTL